VVDLTVSTHKSYKGIKGAEITLNFVLGTITSDLSILKEINLREESPNFSLFL